jgi:hypothetical protein
MPRKPKKHVIFILDDWDKHKGSWGGADTLDLVWVTDDNKSFYFYNIIPKRGTAPPRIDAAEDSEQFSSWSAHAVGDLRYGMWKRII